MHHGIFFEIPVSDAFGMESNTPESCSFNFLRTMGTGGHLLGHTELKKVLGLLDVISFGVSATVGSGVFVSIGYIARYYTGPSLFLCFGVVLCAVLLSAFCFAEFSSKIRLSGMGYSYTYATYGELVAFSTGVVTFLSYCLGTAAVARGWGDYLRCFIHAASGFEIPEALTSYRINEWLSLSLLAPGLCAASALIAISGMKESARIAKFLVVVNVSIMVLFVAYGLGKYGDVSNMTPLVLPDVGWVGVLKGSGLAFFCMIGWDLMCSMTEEMKNPVRDLPRGIISTLALVGLIYCGVSITLSCMVPNSLIDPKAPVASAFLFHGDWTMYLLVSFVATSICMSNVLTGAIGPPRVVYTMASDGLLFKALSRVSAKAQVPRNATLLCGGLNVLMSGCLDFHQLASLTSCFSLIGYILVSGGILILRVKERSYSTNRVFLILCIFLFIVSSVVFQLEFLEIASPSWYVQYLGLANGGTALLLFWVYFQQCAFSLSKKVLLLETKSPTFNAPLVPLTPMLAMWINCFMLASLGRTAVGWSLLTLLGCAVVYFGYGARHSRLR